eukprot:450036_1
MDEFKDSLFSSAVAKCEENIQAAELLLQTEDTLNATRHIKAAKKIIRELPLASDKRTELDIKCRGCNARILETKSKYLAASFNYFEISKYKIKSLQLDDTASKQVSTSFEDAIKCAILAKACVARDGLLEKLCHDQRSENSISFKMLKYMHQNRIISQQDLMDFGTTLPLKDQTLLIGDLTVLQKAVYEHNIRSTAKIYKNIRMKDLSVLLGMSMTDTEDLARFMIQENRLEGQIDQIDQEITFDTEDDILYKNWNAPQMSVWIEGLTNGRFKKYCDILRKGFIEGGITG